MDLTAPCQSHGRHLLRTLCGFVAFFLFPATSHTKLTLPIFNHHLLSILTEHTLALCTLTGILNVGFTWCLSYAVIPTIIYAPEPLLARQWRDQYLHGYYVGGFRSSSTIRMH